MDIYLLYAYVGAVCAVVIAIILNRVKSTEYKDTIDRMFCGVLMFFIAFCTVDALWGIIGSPYYFRNRTAYLISTYGFHLMAAWASFVCSAYVLHHLHLQKKTVRIFQIIRIILIVAQMILLFQNFFTGYFFTIDAESVYHSGGLRTVAFWLQFCHYIPIIVYLLLNLASGKKDKETVYSYRSSLIFSVLPLVFGILQMLYPDGSFYSLGFLITSVTMYAFNVTEQREEYLAGYYAAEEAEKSRARIEEALDKAEAASAAKTVFLANMSHDIRTPINGIMGMVTLANKEEMSDTVRGYFGKIDVASRHLLSLVNDVLDMSRIESGKAEIICDPTDVRIIVDNCASIIQGQAEEKGVRFIKEFGSTEHSRVLADVLHVRQILINILGNAVKFTPEGGSVTFRTEETAFDGKQAEYAFTVTDTGIGMEPEFIEHIFEAFSQENNKSRANYQGTGLGMTISAQLASLMGGHISVDSTPGKGSTFVFRAKFDLDTSEPERKEKSSEGGHGIENVKILLAEDNELNMEIAKTLLEDGGAVVTPAENGKQALEAFLSNPPHTFDVILMDIMMPEMNGYEATKAIRASGKEDAGSIPIIAMTANAFAEDKLKAMEAGMNAHTAKPINFPVLVSEIDRFLH